MKFFFVLGIVTFLSGALNSNANANALEATLDGSSNHGFCACKTKTGREGNLQKDGSCIADIRCR
jgi:hypothetical protein